MKYTQPTQLSWSLILKDVAAITSIAINGNTRAKHIKSLFITMLLTSIVFVKTSLAQATTLEEYNYMVTGYQTQVEQSLEMRKGYFFKDLDRYSLLFGSIERSVRFKALYRNGDKKPCGILAIYKRTDNGKHFGTQYFCLPVGDSGGQLWDKTLESLNKSFNTDTAKEFYSSFLYASLNIISKLMQE